jgi:hypothetical protein
VSCLDSNHMHQSKVAMTCITRVATRGSFTYYLANKVLVTSVDFWFRIMGQNYNTTIRAQRYVEVKKLETSAYLVILID